MIFFKLNFGSISDKNPDEAENVAQTYLASLCHDGQIYKEYFLFPQNGCLCAYMKALGSQALSMKYHSERGAEDLKKVIAFFGKAPEKNQMSDNARKRDVTWKNAPFLYLFTHAFDDESPLCRGDNGRPVPVYRLKYASCERSEIYRWQCTYRELDSIWLDSGKLEIPAYKLLAEPDGELALAGREICARIEKTTGIPTYYYLMRYWGRKKNEEKRKCPGCGRSWHKYNMIEQEYEIPDFFFQCDRCRLVSSIASNFEDERHAVIGDRR